MDTKLEKEKRKIHRSPSYPVFDLSEAIQKADAVYRAEKRTATTPEVIASHIGYSQANGPGGRAVSALRQYGLIEESGGKYRISDLGYMLVHYDRNSQEWKTAASQAALKPTLFKELLEEYLDGLPSDATLRNDLLKRGFNPAAISDVVSIFRNTMSLVASAGNGYTGTGEDPQMATGEQTIKSERGTPSMDRTGHSRGAGGQPIQLDNISTPVGKDDDGKPVFAHVRFDSALRKEFVTGLKKYLDYLETTLQ